MTLRKDKPDGQLSATEFKDLHARIYEEEGLPATAWVHYALLNSPYGTDYYTDIQAQIGKDRPVISITEILANLLQKEYLT